MNTVVQLRPSQSEKPTVRTGRAKNTDYRQREYLTEGEIDSLVAAAGNGRNPVRDRLLILTHSGTPSESVSLLTFAGSRSTSTPRLSISVEPRTVLLESIACRVMRCGCCGRYVVSILTRTSCSCPSARHL